MEIDKCLESVVNGIPYFSAVIDGAIEPQLKKIKLLSPSQRHIERMVVQGNSSKDIGDKGYFY